MNSERDSACYVSPTVLVPSGQSQSFHRLPQQRGSAAANGTSTYITCRHLQLHGTSFKNNDWLSFLPEQRSYMQILLHKMNSQKRHWTIPRNIVSRDSFNLATRHTKSERGRELHNQEPNDRNTPVPLGRSKYSNRRSTFSRH